MTSTRRTKRSITTAKNGCAGSSIRTPIEGVWSLFKRSVVGTYHQLSAKHLPAYLDEMAFRFNNRNNAFLFRDTLLRMIEGETLPYAELIADEVAA